MASEEEDEDVPSEIEHYGINIRRKLKLEAHVTSGCGKHKEKIRTIETFWDKVWPELEAQGWTKVRRCRSYTHHYTSKLAGLTLRLILDRRHGTTNRFHPICSKRSQC